MNVVELWTTAQQVFASLGNGVGKMMEYFTTALRDLFPSLPWEDLPQTFGDTTLLAVLFGTGVLTFLTLTLVKWVVDFVT